MSYTKTFLKSKPECKVRFSAPPDAVGDASGVFLVADFNEWSHTSLPMKCGKDGCFSVDVNLPSGKDYQFRYLTDTGKWFNDDAADAYTHCEHSGEKNSVIKV